MRIAMFENYAKCVPWLRRVNYQFFGMVCETLRGRRHMIYIRLTWTNTIHIKQTRTQTNAWENVKQTCSRLNWKSNSKEFNRVTLFNEQHWWTQTINASEHKLLAARERFAECYRNSLEYSPNDIFPTHTHTYKQTEIKAKGNQMELWQIKLIVPLRESIFNGVHRNVLVETIRV